MIDPLGPDPFAVGASAKQVNPDVEILAPAPPRAPQVNYANVKDAHYDDPAASIRIEPAGQPAPFSPSGSVRPSPSTSKPATALARPAKPRLTTFERAISVARTVLPYVGKMLPLLEGNVVTAAGNLFANPPSQLVDLKPLEDAIARLQADQRALTFHTTEQKRALQRLEDEFAAVQEAVQKNAAGQAELSELVAKLAKRTSSFMRLVIILLVASLLFSTLLSIRIAYMIR